MPKIKFSEEAKEAFDFLTKENNNPKQKRIILNSLRNKIELTRLNIHHGNPIKKKLIPEYYKTKYSADNLFRIELAQFWRMLYTLTDEENEPEIIIFILDILDHDKYNKRFKYRKN